MKLPFPSAAGCLPFGFAACSTRVIGNHWSVVLCALLGLAAAAATSQAAILPVLNSGFENPPLSDDTGNEGDLNLATRFPDWSAVFGGLSNGAIADLASGDLPVPVGDNCAYLYSLSTSSTATLNQTITGYTFQPNTTYELKVLVGDLKKISDPSQWPFASASIHLLAAGSPIASLSIGSGPGDGLAAYYTLSYTAPLSPPAGTIGIRLAATDINTNDADLSLVLFDDVTLTLVPEPSSWAMLAFGTAMMSLLRGKLRLGQLVL